MLENKDYYEDIVTNLRNLELHSEANEVQNLIDHIFGPELVTIKAMQCVEKNILFKQGGETYRCEQCGNNVFSRYKYKEQENIYGCNSCNQMYKREENVDEK